jgi:hypothetical protein
MHQLNLPRVQFGTVWNSTAKLGLYNALFLNDEPDEGGESSVCRTWRDDHRERARAAAGLTL